MWRKQAVNAFPTTKRQLWHQSSLFCCILRVGKCIRNSSHASPISSYVCNFHTCARLCVSMELPKFRRRRQEICSSPHRPPSILCTGLFDGCGLAGRKRGMRFCLLICQQIAMMGLCRMALVNYSSSDGQIPSIRLQRSLHVRLLLALHFFSPALNYYLTAT